MAKVSVVGLGKLGAPLAAVLSSKGHQVVGVDLSSEIVSHINAGKAPTVEPGLQELIVEYPFRATTDFAEISGSDISFVIVPTPSIEDGSFSNQYVIAAIEHMGAYIEPGHVVVITSTVMPGSCDGVIREALESATGLRVGQEIGLCYSPEFIALGSVIENMLNPDMVLVGASDQRSSDVLCEVLDTVNDAPLRQMNLLNAEIAKISVNTFITMKISYANQLAEICERLEGADANIVVDAVGLDGRIGRKYLTPGTAYGGPCFPRDTKAFSRLGANLGVECDLAGAAENINQRQVDRLIKMVPDGVKIGVIGLSYKVDTPVTDESPGLLLAKRLTEMGRIVRVYDPLVTTRQEPDLLHSASLGELLSVCDFVFLMVPDNAFAFSFPAAFEKYPELRVVDCWNLISPGPWDETHIIKLGRG